MVTNTTNGSGSSASDEMLGKLMERGFRDLDAADRKAAKGGSDEKMVKLFGLVEVPEMFATVAEGLWNEFSDEITKSFQKSSQTKLTQAGKAIGLYGNTLTRAVAATQIGINTLVKAAPYVNPIKAAFTKQTEMNRDLARKLAPALDELKGHQGVGTLHGVKESQNEMIYYARKRIALSTSVEIGNSVTKLAINVLPNMLLELPNHKRMLNGELPLQGKAEQIQGWGGRIARMGAAPVANAVTHSRERKLKQTITTPYSAAEMVTELAGQIENNPKASSFQLPGKNGGTASLERYIEQICQMHQKNMAEINNDHVEIRPALKEDLEDASKLLAKAIREGEMSTMSLIRLVGTGKIVKAQGRAIASQGEIEKVIEQEKEHPAVRKAINVDDHYKSQPYTEKQNKEAIDALEGIEKDFFVAMEHHDVLRRMGLSDPEIKQHLAAVKDIYERMIAETVMGLHGQSQESLKEFLAGSEIRALDKASENIQKHGIEAVHNMKAGPTNPQGIEDTILKLAVPTIVGQKVTFGKVLEQGRIAMSEITDKKQHYNGSSSFQERENKREHTPHHGSRDTL